MKYDLCAMINDYCNKTHNRTITDKIMKCIKSINDANIEELSGLRVDSQTCVSRDLDHIPLKSRNKTEYYLEVTKNSVNIVPSVDKRIPFYYFKDTEGFTIMRYANSNDVIEIRYSLKPDGIKGRIIILTDIMDENGKMDDGINYLMLMPDYEQNFRLCEKQGITSNNQSDQRELEIKSDDIHEQFVVPRCASIDNIVRAVACLYCETYHNSINVRIMKKQ